jgi:hypothetical protein
MFDELERLCGSEGLRALLGHYAERGRADRQAWQDRVLEADGLGPRELTRLHGELLAFGWVEQNTGSAPGARPGEAPACYRVTPAGLRALRRARTGLGK